MTQPIELLLDKIPPEALKQFVQARCNEDEVFHSLFVAHFIHLDENKSKADYQAQISAAINAIADEYGFIGWRQVRFLQPQIDPIMAMAEKHIEKNDNENAIAVLTAIMEEMLEAMEFCDDSDGVVGGYVDEAYETLVDISQKQLSEGAKNSLRDYCYYAFEQEIYQGWEWHLGMLRIANNLADSEEEADVIIAYLEGVDGIYRKESAQRLQLEIIKKYKDKKTVQAFIDAHIANASIRQDEIKKAVAHKQFDKAIKLCHDGIANDEKDSPGLAKDWYDWLLTIALQQNDKAKIIEYARFRLINDFSAKHDYYAILKQHVADEAWNDFLQAIIAEVGEGNHRRDNALVRQIYINEKWWDKLLALLKKNASLPRTSQ